MRSESKVVSLHKIHTAGIELCGETILIKEI